MLAEKRDEIDNPLIWPILSILESTRQSWKVHHLLGELRKETMIAQLDDDPHLDLFKRNFLIMNALYQLQEMLLPQQWLQVESMDIQLQWRVSNPGCVAKEIDYQDPLRDYYMDWNNYDASQDDVKELLSSFWKHYQRHIGNDTPGAAMLERYKALNVLGLDENASEHEIRRQWRKNGTEMASRSPKG